MFTRPFSSRPNVKEEKVKRLVKKAFIGSDMAVDMPTVFVVIYRAICTVCISWSSTGQNSTTMSAEPVFEDPPM